jgi:4-hydroxybenzoate polyprenyltransferase
LTHSNIFNIYVMPFLYFFTGSNILPERCVFMKSFVQLIRAKDWWTYKLGPILATGYATAVLLEESLIQLWPTLLLILAGLFLSATFASLINDACDLEEDRMSGKPNQMEGRSRISQFIIVFFSLLACIGLTYFFAETPLIACLYAADWLIFALYSIPPVRLKHRAVWGVVAMGLGESMLPHLFATAMVAHAAQKQLPILWWGLIAGWSLLAGFRAILWHQLKDHENDQKSGVRTFTSIVPPHRIEKWVQRFLFPAEIIAFAVILFLINNLYGWVFLIVYGSIEFLRNKIWKIPVTIIRPAYQDRLLMFEFYDFLFPLSSIIWAVVADIQNGWVLVIFLLLYISRVWWWTRDAYTLLRWELPKRLLRQA